MRFELAPKPARQIGESDVVAIISRHGLGSRTGARGVSAIVPGQPSHPASAAIWSVAAVRLAATSTTQGTPEFYDGLA